MSHSRFAVGRPRALPALVDHVVVQQRRGVDELDRGREADVVVALGTAAEPGRGERQQRAQPLAAGLDQMRGDLGDARGRRAEAMRSRITPETRAISGASRCARRSWGVGPGCSEAALAPRCAAAMLISAMRELLRTTDPTVIAFATALLDGEGIETFPLDVNMSVLEGSIGILPRRLMVRDRDHFRAAAVLRDNAIEC